MKRMQDHIDITWHQADWIEPGIYLGYCRDTHTYFDSHWHRWVCATQWDIFDDSGIKVIAKITKFFNLGEGKKPKATSRRSNYWRAWVDANGGVPRLGESLTDHIFRRRFGKVDVGDVERNFNQMQLADDEIYSVIRRIVSWETGHGSTTNKPATNLGRCNNADFPHKNALQRGGRSR